MHIDFEHIDESWIEYQDKLKQINDSFDFEFIKKAYYFAWDAHKDQKRKSGEPYICHPAAAAFICAEQGMDSTTIVSSLLHDVIEDTEITYEDISNEFNETVATLVEGVTKIEAMALDDKEERLAETYRKMLITTNRDIRVIIIKFADRIHNLRTLTFMKPEKKKAVAKETLDIYAPLAHRLGMGNIRTELEDLAFRHYDPDKYNEVVEKTASRQHLREDLIDNFRNKLSTELDKYSIDYELFGRPKHYYSIYRKFKDRSVPYNEIYDLLAMRVICHSREECYQILGVVHSLWTPVPDKLKDYIASPKSNGYQSIHTTIAGPKGNIVEVQIRTWEMHYIAEEGVAAHWRYKNSDSKFDDSKSIQWLRNLVKWQKEFSNSIEFYEFFKVDIEHREITIRTPAGKEFKLPKGATVLDFAFAIHSDMGIHCIGGKVNSLVEKSSLELKDGDTVEILHSLEKSPILSSLQKVRTPKARSEIKKWFKKKEEGEQLTIGQNLLFNSFEELHLAHPFSYYANNILEKYSLKSTEELFKAIAIASIELKEVIEYIAHKLDKSSKIERVVKAITGTTSRIVVDGDLSSTLLRYAVCCHPLPGDNIVGFITNGRGVSVHRKDCEHTKHFIKDKERVVKLFWDKRDKSLQLLAKITMYGIDRSGLAREICETIEKEGFNITEISFIVSGKRAKGNIKVEVGTLRQLQHLKKKLRNIKGISKVTRDVN